MRTTSLRSLVLFATMVFAANTASAQVFTHSIIKVPFEVRADEPWSQIIETQEEWIEFYETHALNYLQPDSELAIPPTFDFDSYTIVAGGLDGSYTHSNLMIGQVTSSYIAAAILTPEGQCNFTAGISWPQIVVLIPKPTQPLSIYTTEYKFDCTLIFAN